MKKIYFLLLAIFSGALTSNAQSISVTKTSDGSTVANNATIYVSVAATMEAQTDFNLKNTSGSTKSFKVKRYDDQINVVNASSGDSALPRFCTGTNCYPPATKTSTTITLSNNANEELLAYLVEASVVGTSTVRYEIYDINNTSDKFTLSISYNNPLSVKSNASLFSNVSEVFPNPSVSNTYINVNASASNSSVKISIVNALGAVVSSKMIELTAGKNTVSLDSENLPTGIYFVTLSQGASKITRKITISK